MIINFKLFLISFFSLFTTDPIEFVRKVNTTLHYNSSLINHNYNQLGLVYDRQKNGVVIIATYYLS